ncbi:20402_t:CDS:1 [Racocetra persica]|uniref:20402_t:CDS:1 n=1 Tax=Racocetra persica TaxID=160502 RepID=A0ACA9NLS4_9GLOM|nr:20402_t:CDS:1 [Racocetra persica]
MINADDVCCNYESTIYGPSMNVSTTPLVAGQSITLNITGVFEQDIITDTNVYIELVINDYSSENSNSVPEVYSGNLQICKNNVPCPVPAGKYVEAIVAFKIPDGTVIENLAILSYIGYKANNNVFITYGCSCNSEMELPCSELQ